MAEAPTIFDPLLDEVPARFVVGIDLGTTNCAVMYVDTAETPWQVRPLAIPQLIAPHQIEARDTLPSFHYQWPATSSGDTLRLPWQHPPQDWCVGVMAREEGLRAPERLIASAKSWLCHSGVDRTAKLLPWQGAADVERLSPVEASSRYLAHIRDAWNAEFPDHPLSRQDIVVTLPASFDEVARELTVQSAAAANLTNVILIEEPQAAFYAWVYKHNADWPNLVEAGNTILVCDIGGGTSDFTLIKVRPADDDARGSQRVQFHRVAVGDHLILGGDNLDLALAQYVERKLTQGRDLDPRQWEVLVRSCRRVKEALLGPNAPDRTTINLPGASAKLVGGALQAELTRDEVEQLLVDGFLPGVSLHEAPISGQSGFREFGLPFASDPAITRHLAAFLSAHGDVAAAGPAGVRSAARPDVVLFNGGFFASPKLRERLLQVLSDWFTEPAGTVWQPKVLDNDRLDLAVARGAAYYGMVRRGEGVRIAANLARSYYMAVESDAAEPQAICIVPGYAEPGQDIALNQLPLELTIAQPAEFSLYVSSTRLTDPPGEIVEVQRETMKPLPPIRTVLRTDRRNQVGTLPVTLHAHLSEIGTIDLWCQALQSDNRWRLQFDVRAATQTNLVAHESAAEAEGIIDDALWTACEQVLASVFGPDAAEKPSGLVKQMAVALELDRFEWPTSLLRRIWESLMRFREGRRRSPAHEARWLNLLGFSLRPGYGLAVDDWRVAETWRHVRGKLVHPGASGAESLILWRRIAGGLSMGQQQALAEPLIASLRAVQAAATTAKKSRGNAAFPLHESSEAWRLLGSLELLTVPVKQQIGNSLTHLMIKRKYEKTRNSMIWALGRLGQRQPVYGPLNGVVPTDTAQAWCQAIMNDEACESSPWALMQLARSTGDRYRDLNATFRDRVVTWLADHGASPHTLALVAEGGDLGRDEQDQVFGEALPKGFRIP